MYKFYNMKQSSNVFNKKENNFELKGLKQMKFDLKFNSTV